MTTKDEALKLALEALEAANKHHNTTSLPLAIKNYGSREACAKAGFETWLTLVPYAIETIREALAEQPRLLSAAQCDQCGYNGPGYYQPDTHQCASKHHEALAEQPAQQEPVAWMWRCKPYCNWPEWSVSLKRPADSGRDGHKRTEGYEDVPLYTFPPASKPWVGLTQQDIDIAFDDTQEGGGFNEFARAIEAKLREKNA